MKPSRPLLTLYRSLSPRRRRHFAAAMAAMLVAALAEMLTIGAALAFLAVIADHGTAVLPAALTDRLGGLRGGPVVGASLLLAAAALLLMLVRLALLWVSHSFVGALGRDIGTRIFGRMLRQPYSAYLLRNSSELLAGMEKVQRVVMTVLQPAMQALIAAVLAAFIAALLFAIDPFAASVAALSVVAAYAAVIAATRRRLRANSTVGADAVTGRMRVVREGLGGIRDILLDRSQPLFEARFDALEASHRRVQVENGFIAAAPRYVVEAAGIIALALVALLMTREPGGLAAAVPVLGALALGAQRLLPLIQQGWLGWSHVAANLQTLEDVVELMGIEVQPESGGAEPLPFESGINFERVSYRYPAGQEALSDVSIAIAKGERVGISGTTGSGKSTLLDLLMGLIEPSEGEIRIDGRPLDGVTRPAWQARIAHVPQSIYLTDDSIAANIAFGDPAPDEARLIAAARAARVDGFAAALPQGYDTTVGERGVRLSGGQRQRIGLARALYKGAAVLILDEATSALDDATEAEVIGALGELAPDVTIVMVAHRASSLALCHRTIRIEAGRIA